MRMPRSLVLGQVVLLLVASAGCAAKTARPWMPERVRAELGAVAVVVPPAPPEPSLAYPVPSRPGAAVAGAGAGLGAGVLAGAACLGSYGIVWPACLIALWTPVMVVTGGVEGALKGVPVAELRASASSLKDAASEPDLARSLAERVAAEASRRVGAGRVRFAADALAEAGAGSPRYPALAADGVDTVLEVRLERLGLARAASHGPLPGYGLSFSVEKLIDSPLALVVKARVRVLRAADGTARYESAFTYRAGSQKFTEWGREVAAEFRRERDQALAAVAEDIARTIFGLATAPPESASPAPAPDEAIPPSRGSSS